MCKYPANKPDCKLVHAGLDDEQRKAILKKHNRLRQKVAVGNETKQPAAANMMKLSWNYEAEDIAQRWTERCPTVHDSCRRMKDGTAVGQNIMSLLRNTGTTNRSGVANHCIQHWYNEVKSLDTDQIEGFTSIYSYDDLIVGHYTAIVSSDTKQLGCGYVEKGLVQTDMMAIILTCNYVPTGNVKNRPIYKVGAACSACPKGSKCSVRYPGLCTDEEDEYNDIPKHRDKHKPRRAQAISIHPSLSSLVVLFVHVYFRNALV
ncbi:hypothetical protein J6590_013448 [Homalodisca vitripennis]|nr:hypothetical protein J6590_013448 [Homalodisca vitripennis]